MAIGRKPNTIWNKKRALSIIASREGCFLTAGRPIDHISPYSYCIPSITASREVFSTAGRPIDHLSLFLLYDIIASRKGVFLLQETYRPYLPILTVYSSIIASRRGVYCRDLSTILSLFLLYSLRAEVRRLRGVLRERERETKFSILIFLP